MYVRRSRSFHRGIVRLCRSKGCKGMVIVGSILRRCRPWGPISLYLFGKQWRKVPFLNDLICIYLLGFRRKYTEKHFLGKLYRALHYQERGLTPSEASRPASEPKGLYPLFIMIWKLFQSFLSTIVILCSLTGRPRGFWRCQAPFLILRRSSGAPCLNFRKTLRDIYFSSLKIWCWWQNLCLITWSYNVD